MKKILVYFVLFTNVVWYYSCKKKEKYQGYSKTSSGLYYKLEEIGDGEVRPQKGDILQLHIAYAMMNDSVFLDTRYENAKGLILVPFSDPSYHSSFEECFSMMSEGDSVSCIVKARPVFDELFKERMPWFLKENDSIKVRFKLHRILNDDELRNELISYNEEEENRDIEEQRKIVAYVNKMQPIAQRDSMGYYYINEMEGVGYNIEYGDVIKIRYKGYFIDGKLFDYTVGNSHFEFRLGDEAQLIRGLELGIKKMKRGGKMKFILPSFLAYGSKGSVNKVVPPYSPVIYDVEIIEIQKSI